MTELLLNDFIPDKHLCNLDLATTIHLNYLLEDASKIKIGDIIATCNFKGKDNSNIEIPIYSNKNGFFRRANGVNGHVMLSVNSFFGKIYNTFNELCNSEYKFNYSITEFILSNNPIINWETKFLLDNCYINLNVINKQPTLIFIYNKNEFKLKKGDNISFFNKKHIFLELTILQSPYVYDKDHNATNFILLEQDLKKIYTNYFFNLVITYKDGKSESIIPNKCKSFINQDILYNHHNYIENSTISFRRYVSTYKKCLEILKISFNPKTPLNANKTYDTCFVYLMEDNKNGYYKIGISKTPEYREKTLQSEKPSINMVCKKEYPTRKIAEAIESALHKVYDNKRIRGEWFNLDKNDIDIITKTLS